MYKLAIGVSTPHCYRCCARFAVRQGQLDAAREKPSIRWQVAAISCQTNLRWGPWWLGHFCHFWATGAISKGVCSVNLGRVRLDKETLDVWGRRWWLEEAGRPAGAGEPSPGSFYWDLPWATRPMCSLQPVLPTKNRIIELCNFLKITNVFG